jgi:hypothetical protein
MQRLLEAKPDGFEAISEQVMRMPEPQLQRACGCGGACAQCQTERPDQKDVYLQRNHTGIGDIRGATAPPIVQEVLSVPGHPLEPSPRGFMEPRFGYDLSHVRIHTDRKAAKLVRAVEALAYTEAVLLYLVPGNMRYIRMKDDDCSRMSWRTLSSNKTLT